ncbi:MAG: hypothetical protein IPI01_07775 [Ignavibacteriae bacterium]|nr:hypothetical protein [Ignavibacteriota bacterium]
MKAHSRNMTIFGLFIGLLGSVAGCAAPFQGIKYRAQAPSVEEAFRTLSLAITVDGYQVEHVDPAGFTLESGWRTLKRNELSAADTSEGNAAPEGRIVLKLVRRGALYDVLLTPLIRTKTVGNEAAACIPPTHPLRIKWEKAITRLIERESRDED